MGYGRYLLCLLSFLHFSCSEDDVLLAETDEVLEQGSIVGYFRGDFLKFTVNTRNNYDNFYHLGAYGMLQQDRIVLTRCMVENNDKCITITINGSALDSRTPPFTVGENPDESGIIELVEEGFVRSTGATTKNEIVITVLSKENDILEGTFAGRISNHDSSILTEGKFRIEIFRYLENIDLDSCEANLVNFPTSVDPPLLTAMVDGEPIEWIGDGCNFRFFRDYGTFYTVILNNEKLFSPPTKQIRIGFRFEDINHTTGIIDSVLGKHEVGIKEMAFHTNDNGFRIQLTIPDMVTTVASYSTLEVEQPVNAFEIISRSEIQNSAEVPFPWFDYKASLNLRMRGTNAEEILVVGEVFMRGFLSN